MNDEKMKLETRERLVEFFRPYNKKLFGLSNHHKTFLVCISTS